MENNLRYGLIRQAMPTVGPQTMTTPSPTWIPLRGRERRLPTLRHNQRPGAQRGGRPYLG